MNLREGLVAHYRVLGLRGVAAITMYRLCRHPATISASSKVIPNAVELRLGTTDLSLFNDILLRDEYGFGLPERAETIVDAGANVGFFSVYCASKFPDATILAIEAEQSNFDMLRRNVAPYPNIRPIHAALWNHEGSVAVKDPAAGKFGKWGFRVEEGCGVPAITVPKLMNTFGLQKIDLLKCDIEGAEKEVFENCNWMSHVGTLIVETHDRFKSGCSMAVRNAAHGFTVQERGELTVYTNPLIPSSQYVRETVDSPSRL